MLTRELKFYHQPPPTSPIYAASLIILALPISLPRFRSIILIKMALNLSYFCKKIKNFQALGAPLPDP